VSSATDDAPTRRAGAILTVNLGAIAGNWRGLRDAGRTGSPHVDCAAVLKADAYGTGATRVGPRLAAEGCRQFFVAHIDEGIALRAVLPDHPIYVLNGLLPDTEGDFVDHALTPVLNHLGQLNAWRATAQRFNRPLDAVIHVDTGMHRLGFRHDNLARTLPPVLASPHLRLDGVFTHFASADVPDSPLFDQQRTRFDAAIEMLRALGGHPPLRHAANSAALLRDSRVWYDAVRPGLLLYGIVPPPLASTIALTPAMSLTSRIVAVKGLRPGEGVGYGSRFSADEPRAIAVVPAGYADGLDTRMANRASVLVRGHRAPVVGAISMDMMTIDVTGLGDVEPGDEVVIIGRQGDEGWQQIDAREMAAVIGTIPWEIVCRLGTRVERVFE